jgi:hypothetical protein
MIGERKTMLLIRHAILQGRLKQPVRAADLNEALGLTWGGTFLPKHCLGTGISTARFVRVSRGLLSSLLPAPFFLTLCVFYRPCRRSLTFRNVADR